jgi:hypothetical protein
MPAGVPLRVGSERGRLRFSLCGRDKGVDGKEPKVAPHGMKQLYLKDPDNFGICFQSAA